MKKMSLTRTLASIILFLDKIFPSKFVERIINFAINSHIKKFANLNVINIEKLNNIKKPVIFICNHLSNADGLILNKVLKNHDVAFVMGVKLKEDPITNIGVRIVRTIQITPGSPDKSAVTNLIKHVKSGNNILIFPEGTRSRDGSMLKAKKGIYLIARLCNVPVVPLCIYGSELYMPIDKSGNMNHEEFRQANVVVKIGDPIDIPDKEKEESKQEYEERIINYLMVNIAKMLPDKYRGAYKELCIENEGEI